MSLTTELEHEQLVETRGSEDRDLTYDLNHDLSRRLDCLWRYDRYIANADRRPELQDFWRDAKSQEQRNIDQLKKLTNQYVQSNGF